GDRIAECKRDQFVAVEVEREGVAACKRYGPEVGGNGAGIAHAGRYQRGKAAVHSRDRALVDDRGVSTAGDTEDVAAGKEILVLDVARGGEEARRIDDRVGPDQDAVTIDHEYAAISGQRTEYLRRAKSPEQAVEHN